MNVSFIYVDGLYLECTAPSGIVVDIGEIAIDIAIIARRIDRELVIVIHHGIMALRIRVRDQWDYLSHSLTVCLSGLCHSFVIQSKRLSGSVCSSCAVSSMSAAKSVSVSALRNVSMRSLPIVWPVLCGCMSP